MAGSRDDSNDSYIVVIVILSLVIFLALPLTTWIYFDTLRTKKLAERSVERLEKMVKKLEEEQR